jgi:acyl-coenzyme A thioesterase PaaI-like protein
MAQIIKHRRGSLESLSAVTASLQKGEIVIASGSSNLSVTNGASIVFAVPENGQVQAVNRVLVGANAPNTFAAGTYNGMLNGVPYYASGSSTLYLLGEGANSIPDLTGNISNFSSSVSASISALSASIGGGSIGVAVAALNTFSGSTLIRLTNLESTSASVNTSITALNSSSASQQTSIDALNSYTSSNTSTTALNSFTQSAETRFTEIGVVSGSLIASASTAKTTNDSQGVSITNLNSFSASTNASLTELNSYSSSLKTAFTASGVNVTFNGDTTVKGNLFVQGTQTIVDSTTINLGDNILTLNAAGTSDGGLIVRDATGASTTSGSLLWDVTTDYWKAGKVGSESKVALLGGDNLVTASQQILLTQVNGFTDYSGSVSASLAAITANVGAGVGVSITNLNSFSASTLSRLTSIESFSSSVLTQLTEIGVVSGSLIASASTAKTTNDSQGVSITNLNTFSGSQLTQNSTLATYTGSVDTRLTEIGVVSGSLIASASAAKTTNDTQDGRLNNIESFSASVNTSVTALNSSSASQQTSIDALNSYTSSNTSTTALNSFTQSAETRFTEIGVVSGSLISSASNAASRLTTLEGTGTIQGVGTSNNVTFAKVTTTGDVVVGGDLVVQGNTVTLNTATLIVEDKLITLASGSTSSATADGGGIEIAGAGANFIYQHSTTAFTSSVALIAPAVTSSINLGTGAGSSKRIAFRNTNGNLDLVATGSINGDLLQWDGTDFIMSNIIDGGSF